MVLNPRTRFWMYGAVLLNIAAMSNIAQASPVNFQSLRFDDPVGFGFAPDTIISGGSITGPSGTYTLSAELCETGFCQGDSPVDASTQLRLTNLTLSCSSEFLCDPVDITFEAQGFSLGTFANLSLSLDGGGFSGSNFTGDAVICIASGKAFCSQNLSGALASSFFFNQNLSGSLSIPFSESGQFTVFGDFHLDGLANGTTVTLGNSFEVTDITDTAAAPEPSAMFLLPAGLSALVLLRRRRAKRRFV
jgi:hypothetical protein